jgi:NTE family protein
MEAMVHQEKFKKWAVGEIEEQHIYYFKKREADAGWINFKFSLDTLIQTSLPTNLISPVPVDFGLMEFFARPTAACGRNFDSLFVPYRCVASNITDKRQEVFSKGDLGQSVRASMSYPFYIKALNIDNKLYFDGGLYNNFPTDIMYESFKPDIIIGSNVSESLNPPDEDDLISQVKSIFITRGLSLEVPIKVFIIEPKVGFVGLFDFDQPDELILAGHTEALKKVDDILTFVTRKSDKELLRQRRKYFRETAPQLVFNQVDVKGLSKSQSYYVRKLLGLKKNGIITFEELKPKYFRLAADQKIKQIF